MLGLALVVRLVGVGSRLNIDDAYTWFAASSPNAHVFLHRLAANENTPPLIYLVVMLMPGSSPAWLRMPTVICGVLVCLVVFWIARARLSDRSALLATLAVAVSPYLITYSDLARGFMLADLALLIAVWALLSLAEEEEAWKWVVFCLAGAVAVWTEYSSVIVLVALALAALWLGRPRRWPTLALTAVALASLAPWIPQIVRAQDQVGVTKFDPLAASPSLTGLKDMMVTLALGEKGGTASSVGRWLELLVLLAVGAAGAFVLRRTWHARSEQARFTLTLLTRTAVLTLVGYALAAIVGVDVFTQRYITILIPIVAILGADACAQSSRPFVLASICLLGVGLVGVARRYRGEWQPNLVPVAQAAAGMHPASVLTNSPTVLYYLSGFQPKFDRPYNLGRGLAANCTRPCLAIDDIRVHGGTSRPITGSTSMIGPYRLTLER